MNQLIELRPTSPQPYRLKVFVRPLSTLIAIARPKTFGLVKSSVCMDRSWISLYTTKSCLTRGTEKESNCCIQILICLEKQCGSNSEESKQLPTSLEATSQEKSSQGQSRKNSWVGVPPGRRAIASAFKTSIAGCSIITQPQRAAACPEGEAVKTQTIKHRN